MRIGLGQCSDRAIKSYAIWRRRSHLSVLSRENQMGYGAAIQVIVQSTSKTTLLSPQSMYGLWLALYITYLPSDLLDILSHFANLGLIPGDSAFMNLVSPITPFIIRYIKFLFLVLFPWLLSFSTELKASYWLILQLRFARLGQFLNMVGQRVSVSSGSGRTSYNVSVVINEHNCCSHPSNPSSPSSDRSQYFTLICREWVHKRTRQGNVISLEYYTNKNTSVLSRKQLFHNVS
eukprot:sb/3469303/